jgi:hypothetical protein
MKRVWKNIEGKPYFLPFIFTRHTIMPPNNNSAVIANMSHAEKGIMSSSSF